MNHNILRSFLLIILIFTTVLQGTGQTDMPDILKLGTLPEQLNYIEERTRIYEYYRAIREDMFQQLKNNTLDTLRASIVEMTELKTAKISLNHRIDSLNKLVSETRAKMDEAIKTKNNIRVLGMNVNKFVYNSIMWIVVGALGAILAIGILIFKRNLSVTGATKKDLEDIKNEFETYRKQSREAREKMSMDHFNEIRRLRAQSSEHRAQGAEPRSEIEERRNEIPRSGSGEQKAEIEEHRNEILQSGSGELRTESEEPGNANEIKKTRKKRVKKEDKSGQGSLGV